MTHQEANNASIEELSSAGIIECSTIEGSLEIPNNETLNPNKPITSMSRIGRIIRGYVKTQGWINCRVHCSKKGIVTFTNLPFIFMSEDVCKAATGLEFESRTGRSICRLIILNQSTK